MEGDNIRVNQTMEIQLDMASYISSVSVSPTGLYMAFGDADGAIHLMTAGDNDVPGMLSFTIFRTTKFMVYQILGYEPTFNGFEGQPIGWADTSEPLPEIGWTDSTYAWYYSKSVSC